MEFPHWMGRAGLRWLLAGGVATGIAGMVMSETVFRSEHEVRHSGAVSMSHCATTAGRRHCTFQYGFSIGNSGDAVQERIRIAWPDGLPLTMTRFKVADIVGSARKTQPPVVEREPGEGRTAFTIRDLAPNTLVEFEFVCLACPPADLESYKTVTASVEARGSVRHGDPRASALWAAVVNFLAVIGLFI